MKRVLQRIIAISLLAPFVVLAWLTLTESGLQWVYQRGEPYQPAGLMIKTLEGRLIGPITIKGVDFKQNGMLIKTDQITFDWRPSSLLTANIDISSLHTQSLKVFLPRAGKNNQPITLPEINLPWRMTLKNVVINGISINQNEKKIDLQQIKINANTLLSKINIDELNIKTNTLNLNIKGEIYPTRKYRHELEADWEAVLPSQTVIKGNGKIAGDIEKTRLKQYLSSPLQLTLDAEVKDLLDQINWQGKIDVTAFDTTKFNADWPAFKGKINLDGMGSIATTTFSGTLHGNYPSFPHSFDAGLKLQIGWQNNGVDIALLDFRTKDTHFNAKGRIDETLKLNWSIDANNLAELYPQAKGKLRGEGIVTGTRDAPTMNASFNGNSLSILNYEISNVVGKAGIDLFHWQHPNIKLSAKTLKLGNYNLHSLEVNANTRHLQARAVSEVATMFIELKGDAHINAWRGRIKRADIQSPQFSNWQLKAPAKIDVSKKGVVVDTLCWHNKEDANFCMSLLQESAAWKTHLEANKLPLKLFSPWLPQDLKFEGVANATAEFKFRIPNQLSGQARFELPPNTVKFPLLDGESDHWEYLGGKGEVTVNDTGVEITSEIDMTNGDRFHGRVVLHGAKPFAFDRNTQPLQANAQLDIHDLGLIEAIVPEVDNLQGEVTLNLGATGTLSHPKIMGQAHLLKGSLRIPRLGLTVDRFSLKGQSEGLDTLNFHLDAHSGEGDLAIQGQTTLDPGAGWPTEISIKGKEFLISNIPEARVIISPDLQVKLQKYVIDIKGDIHIPSAKLQPKDLTTAARVSKDVVIIGSPRKPEEKWSIFSQVKMTLGEQVTFYGFGFDGRLGGSLLLIDKPGQLTTATGELLIPEGQYRAYGQRLDVEHGRLLYTRGPLRNPGLDVRAVRRVNEVTVGLKVRGSLNQPKIELFSVPAMGQTDTLSYLLLGRPIENASGEDGAMMAKAALALGLSGGNKLARSLTDQFGLDELRVESSEKGDQASLVLGRYLSPRLYVSYGVGLIESFNTFTVQYRITNKWHLKGESGEHQGADILYTIDR